MKEDLNQFNKFIDINKKESRNQIKLAEDETKKKQKKIQELKIQNENKLTLINNNTKLLEKLEELLKYK